MVASIPLGELFTVRGGKRITQIRVGDTIRAKVTKKIVRDGFVGTLVRGLGAHQDITGMVRSDLGLEAGERVLVRLLRGEIWQRTEYRFTFELAGEEAVQTASLGTRAVSGRLLETASDDHGKIFVFSLEPDFLMDVAVPARLVSNAESLAEYLSSRGRTPKTELRGTLPESLGRQLIRTGRNIELPKLGELPVYYEAGFERVAELLATAVQARTPFSIGTAKFIKQDPMSRNTMFLVTAKDSLDGTKYVPQARLIVRNDMVERAHGKIRLINEDVEFCLVLPTSRQGSQPAETVIDNLARFSFDSVVFYNPDSQSLIQNFLHAFHFAVKDIDQK